MTKPKTPKATLAHLEWAARFHRFVHEDLCCVADEIEAGESPSNLRNAIRNARNSLISLERAAIEAGIISNDDATIGRIPTSVEVADA